MCMDTTFAWTLSGCGEFTHSDKTAGSSSGALCSEQKQKVISRLSVGLSMDLSSSHSMSESLQSRLK